tara:strand:+ start:191 stop:547 length:357 start_codon:yes stop_codon:yes gene_type:complete
MLPYSNNSNSEGLEILSLACWRFPEGDWELIQTLFETNERFFIVHPEARGIGNPLNSGKFEPYKFVTRRELIDQFDGSYFVELATSDRGYVEVRSVGNPCTTAEMEQARREMLTAGSK